MQSTSPAPSESLSAAVISLFTAIWRTWINADNYFDKNQWTMIQFLQGSFLLFLALLVKGSPESFPVTGKLLSTALALFMLESTIF
jgi:hypothetical protein